MIPSEVDAMTSNQFREVAAECALAWKHATGALPDGARSEGLYREMGEPLALCLPNQFAEYNLLPDARTAGIAAFAGAGIPWHHGVGGRPGNHLLSSQIQCVNALAPMIERPEALRATFGAVLDIEAVLPFGDPTNPDAHVAFEWVGLADHLNEHPGGAGTRGANNTSADAAIRYRTPAGLTEVALIEWKYVEQYHGGPLSGGAASNETRRERYQPLFEDPDSPVRVDRLRLDDFFVEPLYQLLRLQLLAWRMEAAKELGADRVRLLYAAPSGNERLWRSLHRPPYVGLGDDLPTLWATLLRRPDRFVLFDTAALVAADAVTSSEFKARYGHLVSNAAPANDTRADLEQRARSAVGWAVTVFRRVGGEGGVLEQVLDSPSLDRCPTDLLEELTARAEEAAELARRLRAEEVARVLDRLSPPSAE
jgi:hypothetical protein